MGGIDAHTLRSTLSRPEDLTTIVEAPSHDHQLPLERKTPRFQPNTLICHWLLSPRNITAIPVVSPFVSPENSEDFRVRFVGSWGPTSPGGPVPKDCCSAWLSWPGCCSETVATGCQAEAESWDPRHWGIDRGVGFCKKTGWKFGENLVKHVETSPTRYRKHWKNPSKNPIILLTICWPSGDNGEARHCLAYFSFSSTIMAQWKTQCLQDRPLFLYNFESFSPGSSI